MRGEPCGIDFDKVSGELELFGYLVLHTARYEDALIFEACAFGSLSRVRAAPAPLPTASPTTAASARAASNRRGRSHTVVILTDPAASARRSSWRLTAGRGKYAPRWLWMRERGGSTVTASAAEVWRECPRTRV